MKNFIGKKVTIKTCLGGMDGSGSMYKGVITSVDEEFVCLDNEIYIVRKYIMSIALS